MLNTDVLSNIIPPKTTYNKEYFYGNNTSNKIDNLQIKSIEITDDELISKFTDIAPDEWDNNSTILASFDNTLEAGNVLTGLGYPLDNYTIRRKPLYEFYSFSTADGDLFHTSRYDILGSNIEGGSTLNPTIAVITDTTVVSYKDYTLKNNVDYTYSVYPSYTDKTEGQGLEGNGKVSFYGWILSDIASTPTTAYVFELEVKTDEFQYKQNYKIFENYTQFPAYRFGNMKYRTGKISTMPLTENLEPTDEYMQSVLAFLNNNEEKILRSPSGDVLKVITTDASYKYMDNIGDQPYTVSFNVIEIGSV